MINAKFKHCKGGGYELTVKGHSRSAEKGRDIICSSASILTYTLAQNMMNMHKQGWLECEPSINLRDGDARICAIPKGEYEQSVKLIVYSIEVGFALLDQNYPDFVKVKLLGED